MLRALRPATLSRPAPRTLVGALLLAVAVFVGCDDDDPSGPATDAIPPAAIDDLILVIDRGPSFDKLLVWTAPGDDGNDGTAARYEIRASQDSLTLVAWDAAALLDGAPEPGLVGTTHNWRLPDPYQSGRWFVAVRTFDEEDNGAPLSNVIATEEAVTFPRTTSPPVVIENLEKAWEQMHALEAERFLDEDYVFWFAPQDVDDVGTTSWDRAAELAAVSNLFSGQPGVRPDGQGGTELVPAVVSIDLQLQPVEGWTVDFDDGLEFADAEYRAVFDADMTVRYAGSDLVSQVVGRQAFYVKERLVDLGGTETVLYFLHAWRDLGPSVRRGPGGPVADGGRAATQAPVPSAAAVGAASESLSWGRLRSYFAF